VRAVLSGSVESWHTLVDRYTGLIMSVLRQQLFVEDIDEIRNVYVDVLEDLYRSKLGEYGGRASLATWLVLVTRGKATDYLRRKRGRRQLPRGYDALSEFDRRVFHLYFVEGLDFESVICALEWECGGTKTEELAEAVGRITDTIDGRYLKRIHYEKDARRQGIGAGGLPEFLYRAEVAVREQGGENLRTPEQVMEDREYRRLLERLDQVRRELSIEDQELLALRFEQGRTAKQISAELDMGGQRKVYTALNRAIRRLRALFAGDVPPPDNDPGKPPE
jgi:RNA polymerase sigma factor (sigma-70 family)